MAPGRLAGERLAARPYWYDIPGLPAGNYLFICTIHPESMTGTLIIE
jgi:hypothetical protein